MHILSSLKNIYIENRLMFGDSKEECPKSGFGVHPKCVCFKTFILYIYRCFFVCVCAL